MIIMSNPTLVRLSCVVLWLGWGFDNWRKLDRGAQFLTSGIGQTPSNVKLKVPSVIFFEINNNLLDILGYIVIVF